MVAFGCGASTVQLQQIAGSSQNGRLHTSADTGEHSNIFVEIASGANGAAMLEAGIGKRISDTVSDRLFLEYTTWVDFATSYLPPRSRRRICI